MGEDLDREVETMIGMILEGEDLREEARIEGGHREEEILEVKEDIENIKTITTKKYFYFCLIILLEL